MHRRHFLKATAGLAVLGLPIADTAHGAALDGVRTAAMRGSLSATEFDVRPGALDDQSRAFQTMLDHAAARDMPLFLPPGRYTISNLIMPKSVRLFGVSGATRIVYGGNGYFFLAEEADRIELSDLVLDGANRWLGDQTTGLVDIRRVGRLAIDRCEVIGSSKHGLALERASGRVERSSISGAGDAGIYSVEAAGLEISANRVADCANGGILVHRWQPGEDGTMVTGNRVERIAAQAGGTGQNGNGINIFRANSVIVSGNIVSDCAFSAVRANSASDIQIGGNTCTRSGETAIYAEFSFEGAVINSNIVDQAANGISIVNFDKGGRMATCTANIVRNLSTAGPYPADPPGFGVGISLEADGTASGNVVEGAPLYGMQIGWGAFMRNVIATGNIIRRSGVGIALSVVDGAGSAVVSDNVIDGARSGAVIGYKWAEPATGELAAGGGSYPNLTVERNRVS